MKKLQRELRIKTFHITEVRFAKKTAITGHTLHIETGIGDTPKIFDHVNIQIIKPNNHEIHVNSIMDIIPISTKVLGRLGEGITHSLTGVYVMLTGSDTEGHQMHEFGSSDGRLSEQLMLNKAGTPGSNDFIILVDIILKPHQSYTRELATTLFKYTDDVIQPIREVLKHLNGKKADENHLYEDRIQTNKQKVVIVKQVAGQGAMYDNMLFPEEPSGLAKGVSIIDLNNMPVLLSPNEYRDGAIRAMD